MMIVVLPKLKSIRKTFFCIAIMLAFIPNAAFSQTKNISGKVTDANKNPLANVSVFIKGTGLGTSTASDGSYSIPAPASATEIEFSIVGYETQTLKIGNGKTFSPVLAIAGTKVLEEVVITGINRVKRSQFAGAANKIVARDIENKPVGSFDQIFQGRTPGLLALSGSGQPGDPSAIIIRGQNSISGGSNPLYIVDGIPIDANAFQGLNPNDFASIDVLRDAATQALYGSRGSAGVIVITTKRGSPGRFKLSYSTQLGFKSPPTFPFRPMNSAELLKSQHDYGQTIINGSRNPQVDPVNSNAFIPGWYYSADNPRYGTLSADDQAAANKYLDSLSKINVNLYDQFLRKGTFTNNELSFSGGVGKTHFFSSIGLYKEQGITNPSDMQRISTRNNIDFADDRFSFGISSAISYERRNFDPVFPFGDDGTYIFNSFITPALAAPYVNVVNPDGTLATGNNSSDIGAANYAAAQFLDIKRLDKVYNDQAKITLGVNLGYKISNTLTAAINASADFRETQSSTYNSREAFVRLPGPGQSEITTAGAQSEGLNRFLTSDFRPTLTYAKTIRDKHDIEVTALGEYVQENTKLFTLTGYGIDPRTPNTPGAIQQGNATNKLYSSVGGRRDKTVLVSGLAMLRYTYASKYTITGSYRKDGSSILPLANRWTGFYSLGAVWDITKENFLKNSRALNTIRIKASYGSSGNANNFPDPHLYQATYGSGTYAGLPTQVAIYPGNPEAKWETTYILNLGLDFELLNRRLYGDINLYDKRTNDLYVNRQLPAEGGGFGIDVNAGKLQNKGFEWNVNADVIRKKDLTVTLFMNGGYNKNKLLSLGGVPPYEEGTTYYKVGLPLGVHYEVKWGGVDAATGQPLYYDLDGKLINQRLASNKVTDFGTWEAPWKGGFGTNIHFKNIDLSVLFSWQQGANKVDNLEFFTENPSPNFLGAGYNQSSDLHFWTKPGDVVNTASPLYVTDFSSKYIHDASFIRLRDITLSYTFPKSLTEKSKIISNVRFYVQGTNLYIWTKWRGPDPEAGAVNINLNEYPNPRAITAGLKLTF